ncbi:response regulator receiver protein [Aliterella atlantica CENA595]|uniref:Response regulator receiver protein n=1 Tax=Aliterella atlantica CENA595 TaxID=1618023 RepID=A0A0D8ZQZ6_9CYAN|nr:response regulator receiver protein [Aliterella atlantica CENA595]
MNLEVGSQKIQANRLKQSTVLAVDDNEDNLMLLTEVLKVFDCALLTATHGQMALMLAHSCHPDLILLDVMLPDINGEEVVHYLKGNPQTEDIPVIAVTALAREEDRDRLLRAGCIDYVSKPYMLEDLESRIRCHLSNVPTACK